MGTALTLPLVKVTLLEDRALVERRGELQLQPGTHRVSIGGLSPLAVDRSLQAHVAGGSVTQARVQRIRKDAIPEARREHRTELARRVATLEQEQQRAAADVERLTARLELVTAALADVYRSIAELAGNGDTRPEAWSEQLATVRKEANATSEALQAARHEEHRLQIQLGQAHSARQQAEQPEATLDIQAELEVSHAAGGTTTVTLTYMVPCAAWRPGYRATLQRTERGEEVLLECEAVVWQRTGEEWTNVALAFSTARPTLGASPPRLVEDWLSLRDKTTREKQVVEVSVREEVIQTTGEGGAVKRVDAGLPGMDDGGEALTLTTQHSATVPSDGESHRVPLFRFTAPATSELVAFPEKSPLVHRVARFDNTGPAVLLAGPVDLVRSGGYVGRAQLRFTGKGERVKLGFGSEDALRVSRDTDEEVETSLFGKRLKKHKVKLFLSNMGSRAEAVALEERIPVSEVESVEVSLLKEETKPAPARKSEDGIVRFELAAPPRSQQELSLVYTVASSSKVAGL